MFKSTHAISQLLWRKRHGKAFKPMAGGVEMQKLLGDLDGATI
jgi:hypothetical protein